MAAWGLALISVLIRPLGYTIFAEISGLIGMLAALRARVLGLRKSAEAIVIPIQGLEVLLAKNDRELNAAAARVEFRARKAEIERRLQDLGEQVPPSPRRR